MTDAAATATGSQGQQQAAPDGAAPDTTNTGQQAAGQQPAGQQAQTPEQQQTQADSDLYNDPAKARAEIERLRRERGDERIAAKSTARNEGSEAERLAIVKALAPLLGIDVPNDAAGTPTVESLTTNVAQVTTERDESLKRAALIEAAWQGGIDPTKLGYLEYQLSRDAAFRALNPHADGFADTLAASITALAGKDATLRLTGSAVASGVESLGGAGGQDTITPERFASMNITERSDLYRNDRAAYDRLVGA